MGILNTLVSTASALALALTGIGAAEADAPQSGAPTAAASLSFIDEAGARSVHAGDPVEYRVHLEAPSGPERAIEVRVDVPDALEWPAEDHPEFATDRHEDTLTVSVPADAPVDIDGVLALRARADVTEAIADQVLAVSIDGAEPVKAQPVTVEAVPVDNQAAAEEPVAVEPVTEEPAPAQDPAPVEEPAAQEPDPALANEVAPASAPAPAAEPAPIEPAPVRAPSALRSTPLFSRFASFAAQPDVTNGAVSMDLYAAPFVTEGVTPTLPSSQTPTINVSARPDGTYPSVRVKATLKGKVALAYFSELKATGPKGTWTGPTTDTFVGVYLSGYYDFGFTIPAGTSAGTEYYTLSAYGWGVGVRVATFNRTLTINYLPTLSGTVRNQAGNAGVAGATVQLLSNGTPVAGRSVVTGADGTYSFAGLSQGGNYSVKVTPPAATGAGHVWSAVATATGVNEAGVSATYPLTDGKAVTTVDPVLKDNAVSVKLTLNPGQTSPLEVPVNEKVPTPDPTWPTQTVTFVVQNTGDLPLTGLALANSPGFGAGLTDFTCASDLSAPLAPGASATCTATLTGTGSGHISVNGDVTGTATALGGTVSARDTTSFTYRFLSEPGYPRVVVEKHLDGKVVNGVVQADQPLHVGDLVQWTYRAINKGDAPAYKVTITDNRGVELTRVDGRDPGGSCENVTLAADPDTDPAIPTDANVMACTGQGILTATN